MEREHSITKDPLTVSQRLLRGMTSTFFESGAAVLEGVVLYYYNEKKNVSTKYLGLAGFVMAVLTVYVSILVGNIGDRSTAKFRRKPIVMIFAPLYAAGTFFRFGAFTSEADAPVYYAVTLAMQVIGRAGIGVTNDAWNMELSNEEVDRSKLYSTMTAVGVVGILLGLAMTTFPLVVNAAIVSVGIFVSSVANVILIPEGTPMEKRCFVPMVTNISSVIWNKQYLVYLGTLSMVWFVNSVPPLLMFFLRFVVGQNDSGAKMSYTFCLAAFILVGFVALPCVPKLIEFRGKIFTANLALYGLMACGVVMFGASYWSPYAVIAVFGTVGFFATLSNTVFNVIAADIVDYDELLTGMKRAASYTGVTNLPFMFISTGASSIPLVLMSVLGFTEPPTDDEADDDGDSTDGSTAVLRVWCSIFLSVLGLIAYIVFKNYKIDNDVHIKILEHIFKRDGESESTDDPEYRGSLEAKPSESDGHGVHLKEVLIAPNSNNSSGRHNNEAKALDSVADPITGKAVLPPPFVRTGRVLHGVVNSGAYESLTADERDLIRLLGEYFPTLIMICASSDGRKRLFLIALWKYISYSVLLMLGIWQSVRTLINEDEYGSYLIILLTTTYSIFLAWEILFVKGYYILYHIEKLERLTEIETCLLKAGEVLHKNKPASCNASKSASPEEDDFPLQAEVSWLIQSTALTALILAVSFTGAYVSLNM